MDLDDDSEPEMTQWSSVIPGEEPTERTTKQEKEGILPRLLYFF